MKIKIILIKILSLLSILLNLIETTRFKTKEYFKYTIDQQFNLATGPIYAKGIFKYLEFNKSQGIKPTEFKINHEYNQLKENLNDKNPKIVK